MKRVKNLLVGAAGVAVMVAAGASFAAPLPGSIFFTKHNLGTSNTRTDENHLSAGTAEICVFCHTPHASDTTAVVPLWNRNLGGDANGVKAGYSTYDMLGTSTLDGKIAGGQGKVGSVSLACLSCHDGTQAMDSVINAAGSGGYVAGGQRMAGADWTGSPRVSNADGKMSNGGTFISMLSNDLKNDHPVGIQYAGGCTTAYVAGSGCTTFNDPGFVAVTPVPSKALWYVDTNSDGKRTATDMILYSRDVNSGSSTTGTLEPFVECASCHDPHVAAKATTEVAFLRVTQAGSGVCLACHIK